MTAEFLFEGYTDIDFSPQTLSQEVAQNIRSIISTPKESVPMFANSDSLRISSTLRLMRLARKSNPKSSWPYGNMNPAQKSKLSALKRAMTEN